MRGYWEYAIVSAERSEANATTTENWGVRTKSRTRKIDFRLTKCL